MHSILYDNNNNNSREQLTQVTMDVWVCICVHAKQPGNTCRNKEIDTEQQQIT